MRENLSIKWVKGQKIGDSLLKLDNGNLLSVYPDTFYDRGLEGFWMIKRIGDWLRILKFLRAWAMSAVAQVYTSPFSIKPKIEKIFPLLGLYISQQKFSNQTFLVV